MNIFLHLFSAIKKCPICVQENRGEGQGDFDNVQIFASFFSGLASLSKGVELARGGFDTNGAIPSAYRYPRKPEPRVPRNSDVTVDQLPCVGCYKILI